MYLLPVCTWCCSPKSDDVGTGGSGSDMHENCVVAADITLLSLLFSSRHQLITTPGFRPSSWICKCMKCQHTAGMGTTEKFVNENHWNLVSSWHRTWHTAGVNLPPPPTCKYYEKHTCSRRLIENNFRALAFHRTVHATMCTWNQSTSNSCCWTVSDHLLTEWWSVTERRHKSVRQQDRRRWTITCSWVFCLWVFNSEFSLSHCCAM